MIAYIDSQIKKKCWNLMDSYGEICVHCGCCAEDKKTRYEARLGCLKRWLEEKEHFDDWAYEYPDLMETQKKNVASDIVYYKRKIMYYENKLKNLTYAAIDGRRKEGEKA